MPRKILLIEDDKDIAHLVELHLKDEGYEVSQAYGGTTFTFTCRFIKLNPNLTRSNLEKLGL